jgi:hypothetical protein
MRRTMNETLDTNKGFEQWKEDVIGRLVKLDIVYGRHGSKETKEKKLVYCWNRNFTVEEMVLIEQAYTTAQATCRSLKMAEKCGCFYCLKIFDPRGVNFEILAEKWDDTKPYVVLCPHCGTDTVVVETPIFPVTKEVLDEIHSRQFAPEEPLDAP